MTPKFADIANLEEDRRIELIAHRVKVMWRGNGPLGTIIVKVGIVQ